MQTAFIRHNCSSTRHVLQQLWDEHLVALHYSDSCSTAPNDYQPSGRKALERLWSYCRDGVLVGADYRRLNGAAMLVGNIVPGSRIVARKFQDPASGESFTYKIVQLRDAVEVSYADYPLLVGIQPRQATVTGWPSARAVLEAALNGTPLPREPSSLHPSQLEVLCYEWLRGRNLLERLLMPIGRGLIDIDILGTNRNGGRVIAQVTHSRNAGDLADKERRLLHHARESDDIYFFLPQSAPLKPNPQVNQVAFREVLQDLEMSNDESTKAMLREMFAGGG